jgi:hypothetical protein
MTKKQIKVSWKLIKSIQRINKQKAGSLKRKSEKSD